MKALFMVGSVALALSACVRQTGGAGSPGGFSTMAALPAQGGASSASGFPPALTSRVVGVELGSTGPAAMFIHLSSVTAPAGKVTFVITNPDTMPHELVGFATKSPAANYPITSFEGEANRIDEDKAGEAVVDTGDSLPPGTTKIITADLKPGHYALVCNLAGHYKAGMHVDFWATPKGATPVLVSLGDSSTTKMFIHLSQSSAPAGAVSFIITNDSTTMPHELVGFATKTAAADFPITGFEGEANRIDEDKAGEALVDTGDSLGPGAMQMITADLTPGHYALVCNLAGHYKAGMHVDFWAA